MQATVGTEKSVKRSRKIIIIIIELSFSKHEKKKKDEVWMSDTSSRTHGVMKP